MRLDKLLEQAYTIQEEKQIGCAVWKSKNMTITIKMQKPPIQMDADNVLRVGNTRVTLDTVISVFNEGASAEEIVQQYPSLHLADVYAVISYYLQQREQVEEYLRVRERQAEEVRYLNESRFSTQGLRERLLTRQSKKD